jgi:YjbE family integral membrane protein
MSSITFDWTFASALLSIVLIDLVLAGDNAVVIAMAVRSLPPDQRRKGILFGAGAAVLLRVLATFFVAQLLNISYVKLVGGALILWIAVKLFVEGVPEDSRDRKAASLWEAVKIIVIADITMSLDNMLAVGGASHGNLFLLLFGLALSIPFVVFTSNLLSMLMDKYPVIIYAGAAILGKVGGEMIITDPFTVRVLPASLVTSGMDAPVKALQYGVEALFAAGVIVSGKGWMYWMVRKEKGVPAVSAERPTTAGARPAAILAISRQFGSGGRDIGQAVARELGCPYVDRHVLLADIRRDGPKWEHWAAELDEHLPTVWEKYDWSFRGFTALLQWHILEHAVQGGVVIMGRGGNFVLRGVPHAYRVRIEAPLEVRIERVVKREQVDRETAKWLCEKTDRERAGFLHAVYGGRWDDPAEYDRVFTVNGHSVDREVREIREALGRLPVTTDALKALQVLAAAAKVRAGIATNSALFVPVFDVVPEGDGLVLRGVTHAPKEHHRIEDEARRLAGDRPIRCELHYRK